jgi:hypothetical protein
MDSWTGRTVVYEPAFDEAIRRLGVKYRRLDEALSGLDWALSNKPHLFPQVYGSCLRMARIKGAPGVPNMRIWFTFDDHSVTVIFAETTEDDED